MLKPSTNWIGHWDWPLDWPLGGHWIGHWEYGIGHWGLGQAWLPPAGQAGWAGLTCWPGRQTWPTGQDSQCDSVGVFQLYICFDNPLEN